MVSSAEYVIICSSKVAQLREQLIVRVRESVCYFASQTRNFFMSGGFFISCPAVEIDAERQGRLPILPTKLGNRSRTNHGQTVAPSAFGPPRACGAGHEV